MITKIKLKNFKIFEDEQFDFAPLTLFTGINGMGKSSVIQSLLLLKQSFKSKSLFNEGFVELNNNSFVNLENCEELCNKKAYPKSVSIIIESDIENIYEWQIDAGNPDDDKAKVEFKGSNNYSDLALFKDSFIYLTAERFGPRKSYEKSDKYKRYNTVLGIQGELTPPYIQKAVSRNEGIGIEALIHPSLRSTINSEVANSKLLYNNINAWLGDILGRGVTTKVSDIDKDNVKVSFSLQGSQGDDFSSLQVGFGFSFSMPVIIAPLIAKPGDLIIIENPEAHLHPSAQSKIGLLLALAAENGVQVVLETHSDHVLNGIRIAVKKGILSSKNTWIHFLSPNPNLKRQSFDIEDDGNTSRWPVGFFDEWDNKLSELLED